MRKNNLIKRIKIVFFVFCVLALLSSYIIKLAKPKSYQFSGKSENLGYSTTLNSTATDIVKDMKIGWNLGNTLDSPDGKNKSVPTSYYETLWENPVTTEAMIKKVKDAGFNAVRIPVTWFDHVYIASSSGKSKEINIDNMSTSEIKNIKIEEEWMKRIKEVVDYVDQNNMYCILNVHHDVGTGAWPWIFATTDSSKKEKYEAVMEMLWTQIADEFKDYGVNVLFEGYNEIMIEGASSWVGSNDKSVTSAHFKAANDLNQIFVNTVRKSGGNNPSRFLVLNTYGAEALSEALDGFSFPTDTANKHLIISAHVYDWGGRCTNGTNNTIYNALERLKNKAETAGAAAIIGEFGTRFNQAGSAKAALALNYYVKTAKDFGITCFVWDDGMGKNATMQLLNRKELTWKHPLAVKGLIKGSEGQSITTSEIDTSVEPTKLTLDKSNITIDYDSTYRETITSLIEPANAGKSTAISWKSSDTDIVYVGYDGNIAPKGIPELINIQGPFAGGKEGTATITATITKEDKSTIEASCQVTVKNKELGNIENVNLSNFSNWRKGYYDWQKGYYFANGEDRICANGYLEVKPNTTYTATISDSNLVYTIRELTEDHQYVTTSQNASSSGLIKNGDKITTNSETKFLAVSLHKIDSNENAVTMTTSDYENIFKNNGFKLALTAGDTVPDTENVAVTGVTLTPKTLKLKEGESKTLTAEVQPSNATNKNVTWKSTTPNVATVSNGTVTAINAGTTSIIVETVDGKMTATTTVTVEKNSTTNNTTNSNTSGSDNTTNNTTNSNTSGSDNTTNNTTNSNTSGSDNTTNTTNNTTNSNTSGSDNTTNTTNNTTNSNTSGSDNTTNTSNNTTNSNTSGSGNITNTTNNTTSSNTSDSDNTTNTTNNTNNGGSGITNESNSTNQIGNIKTNENTITTVENKAGVEKKKSMATQNLPNTGLGKAGIVAILVFIVSGCMSYFKLRKNRDIK